MSSQVSAKVKAHTRYVLADGKTRVPGVTTITGRQLGWNTNVLTNWANRMGLDGVDTKKYTDDKADIGTLGHALCTNWLLKQDTDTGDYTQNQIDTAQNCALSFFEWAKGKKIKPILIEVPLASELHRYGGTVDIYAEVDGVLELVDLKTGGGIHPEFMVQVGGGYAMLLAEHGHKVERVRILNIPRGEDESFLEKVIGPGQRETAAMIFLNCLANHRLEKMLSGRGK